MTLPWQFSIVAGLLPTDVDEMVALCNAAGVSAVEGQVRAFPDADDDTDWESIGKRFERGGVRVSTFHLPFGAGLDMASFYETPRKDAVERTRFWIDASARMGCRIGIMHPTTTPHDVTVEGFDRYLDALARSVDDLMPALKKHGYSLAIENMTPGANGRRFGARPEHFPQIAERLDGEHVGFCLDTGHALMCAPAEAVEDYLNAMGDRLIALHLADNAGDRDSHLAPGRGLVDWPRVFGHMERLGFDGVACIETPPFAAGPNYSVEAWRALHEQTTELALSALAADAKA